MSDPQLRRLRPPAEDLIRRVERLGMAMLHSEAARTGLLPPIDVALIEACRAATAIEARKRALYAIDDDRARDVLLTRLDAEQRPFIATATSLVPIQMAAHAIRAAMLQLIDGGAMYADAQAGSIHDALRVAVIHDLATS